MLLAASVTQQSKGGTELRLCSRGAHDQPGDALLTQEKGDCMEDAAKAHARAAFGWQVVLRQ